MPSTITKLNTVTLRSRVPIRLPGAIVREVDRIVRDIPELNYNRQQFIESAVREKIERIMMLERARSSKSFIRVGDHLRPL